MTKLLYLLTILFAAHSVAGENIALHKSATLHVAPNYSLSADADDALQLTDGKQAPQMWADKQSVTWSSKAGVPITIDLGQIENIGEIHFSTAGRYASAVFWPSELCIFLSSDGKTWSYAGDIIEQARADGILPPELAGKNTMTHVFKSRPVLAPARYIGIVGRATGKFLTCDEIQVMSASEIAEPATPMPTAHGIEGMQKLFQEHLIIKGITSRITNDRRALEERIEKSSLGNAQKQSLRQRVGSIPVTTYQFGNLNPAAFRTVFPLNEEHRQIFETQAELWRMEGVEQPRIASAPRYDWLPPIHALDAPVEGLNVKLLREEKRPAMLLVSNPRPEPVTFRLAVKLPESARVQNIPLVSAWTDTREGIAVADALLPLNEGDQFTVPSGMTAKLWLNFDSHGAAAGLHEGAIELSAPDFRETIALNVDVSPVVLKRTPLAIGLWDYILSGPLYGVTSENYERSLAFLKAHEINVAWIGSGALPWPAKLNTQKLDQHFSALAKKIKTAWGEAEYYMIFLGERKSLAGAEAGSEAFNKNVAVWLHAMENAFERAGIAPEKLFLLTVDEPSTEAKAHLSAVWAKAIISSKSRIRTFTDPVGKDMQKGEYMELADIVSPHMQMLYHAGADAMAYFQDLAEKGKTLWFYACSGPVRLADPAAYYRLAPWFAFQSNGSGLGFWAFGDLGGGDSSWNEYTTGRTSYSPVFLGPDSVDTSIHWEALMEGRQDYSYFHMLRDRAKSHPRYAEQVARLLEDAAHQLKKFPEAKGGDALASGFWREASGSAALDEIRLRAIALLEDMETDTAPPRKRWWDFFTGLREIFD